MLPKRLCFLRHIRSEANELSHRFEHGKLSADEERIYRETPNWQYRGSLGCESQATAAGSWLKESGHAFDIVYVSEYIRALETMVHALIAYERPVRIFYDMRVGERGWGDFSSLSPEEADRAYQARIANARLWNGVGGESLRFFDLLARDFLETLHRERAESEVLVVSHGEFITAACSAIEHWHEERLALELKAGVPNAAIVEYSRVNPNDEHDIRSNYAWKRLICPWNLSARSGAWSGAWQEVVIFEPTLEHAKARIEKFPHFLSS